MIILSGDSFIPAVRQMQTGYAKAKKGPMISVPLQFILEEKC